MQFRGRSTPPPYLNRRDQMRMLGLVLALGLVVFAIRVAGQREFWAPIFPDEPTPAPTDVADDRSQTAPVRRGDVTLAPDAEAAAGATEGLPLSREFVFDPHPPREWFAPVLDHSPDVRREELPGYHGCLAMAANASLETFIAAATDEPSRTNLMYFPERYRGRLVTIEGNLVRLLPIEGSTSFRETHGYDQLWDAWIVTPDAPRHPIHCVLTSLPAPTADGREIPRGERIGVATKVRVTGYFFKVQLFLREGREILTPLILGKQPRWFPPEPVVGDTRMLTPYVVVFASVVAVSLGGVLYWYRLSDLRFADAHVRKFTEAPEGAIESLTGIETVDPADLLRQLAEADEED